jgi:pimeloyl-ACP methyl ester carboxylesterase
LIKNLIIPILNILKTIFFLFVYLLINDINIGTITNEGYRTVRLAISETKNNVIVECRYYKAKVTDSKAAVIYVGGVGGGWDSPAKELYPRLSQKLAKENGINSLRIQFRYSTDLEESIVDVLAGIEFLTQEEGITSIGLIGHSFGGAVVISAASIASENIVKAVVTLATQSYGTEGVATLKEDSCSILLIHGNNDEVLSPYCSHYIYNNAHEPKKLILYDNASHSLGEVADKVFQKVHEWLLKNLIKK